MKRVWLIQEDYGYDGTTEVGYTTNPAVVEAIEALRANPEVRTDLVCVALDKINDPEQFGLVTIYTLSASYDAHLNAWSHNETQHQTTRIGAETRDAVSGSLPGRLRVVGRDLEACRKLLGEDHVRLWPEVEANPNFDPLVAARSELRILRGRSLSEDPPTPSSLDNVRLEDRF